MAKKKTSTVNAAGRERGWETNAKTTASTGSGWQPASQGLTRVDDNGNRSASHNGQFVTRKQTYRDLRAAFGLATG